MTDATGVDAMPKWAMRAFSPSLIKAS